MDSRFNTRCNFLRPWYTRPFTASIESPKAQATSFVDNSPRSRSSIAVRIPGVNLFMAADRTLFRSLCKKALSGLARESGISSAGAVPSFPLKSSMDTSRSTRPTQEHKCLVDGNPRQPGGERRFAFEFVQVDESFLEALLDYVFCIFSVTSKASRSG